MTFEPMPAAFLGAWEPDERFLSATGTPMPGASLEPACLDLRGILVISAHWYVNLSAVSSPWSARRRFTISMGFPDELLLRCSTPHESGDVALATEVAEIAKANSGSGSTTTAGASTTAPGFSILVHAFPDADIPVGQLSINAQKPVVYHLGLGAQLAPLRQRGRARHRQRQRRAQPAPRPTGANQTAGSSTHRFDESQRSAQLTTTSSPEDLTALPGHKDFDAAVPTPDHFIPLLYLAGLASATGSTAEVLVDGYTYGSLSMTSYTIDAHWPDEQRSGGGAAALPDPGLVPPDDTNA